MNKSVLFVALIHSMFVHAQNCTVIPPALQGTYEGECKKNKADGKGTAAGEDRYTGNFKNGNPHGSGKYTWKNGDWYEGNWKNGLREGEGTMHYADPSKSDSVLKGYWEKDEYKGAHAKAYEVLEKSSYITINDVSFSKESNSNEITISVENTSGALQGPFPKIQITDICILKGEYLNKFDNNNFPRTYISTLRNVRYPFRARISMGSHILDIEFYEKGSYTVSIKIRK